MKTPKPNSGYHRTNLKSVMRIVAFVALVALIVIPLFSSSSASSSNHKVKTSAKNDRENNGPGRVGGQPTKAGLSDQRLSGLIIAPLNAAFAFMPQQASSIETYDTTCTTLKDSFNLGDTVCVKITGEPTGTIDRRARRIAWVSPYGSETQGGDVISDPQFSFYTIPATATQTFTDSGGGTVVVDNRGTWKVYIIAASDGSVRNETSFTVHDPQTPYVDLSVNQAVSEQEANVAAGSSSVFHIFITNHGPDPANVFLADAVPTNTTFVSFVQNPGGPTFSCTTPSPGGTGNISCQVASMDRGDTVSFTLSYQVDSGTPGGTVITNSVNLDSGVAELKPDDNSSTAHATVASGGGTGTCTIDCPGNITTPADTTENGQSGAIVHFDSPSAEGSCGTVTISHCDDCFFPVGTTVVSATSETGGGQCSFTVTVTEGGAPTITCPPDKTTDANSNCEATVDPGTPTTTGDNVTVTSSRSDGLPLTDPYPAGATTITWTATNSSGTASCQQSITVNDATAPTITCPANITTANDAGQCSATVDPGTATATDSCDSSPSVTGVRSDGQPLDAPYPKGTTTITWTATDNSGNGATCTQTVTVNDTENPVISCPAAITTSNDAGQCSATVDPGTPTASDNCGSPTITGTRSDGQALNAPYPKGTTTITWTATDGSGNSASCTQTVTVNDTESPTVTCPANVTRGTDPGSCSATISLSASATDNCDSNPTVTGVRSDGQSLSAPYPKGTTVVTWVATDSSGNSSTPCAQTITVNDTEAPAISCPANITRSTDPGTCSATVNPETATATDNCDTPTVTGARSDGQALNAPYPKGTTTITWTATDGSNNSSSCTQTITVNDTEAPAISCPANITRSTDPGTCSATVNPGTATATDNCDTPTVTGARSDGQALNAPYPKGTTTITWTATDGSNNSSSCTQTITVNDTEAPAITCPPNITRSNDPGSCSANINPGTATATDNCGSATVSGTRSDGGSLNGSYPVGTTTITWTATDTSGNQSSCTQTITVNDTEAPTISCPANITLEPTCPSGAVGTYTAPAGSDNCPGATTARTAGPASGSVFPIGTTTVTYTVTDAHGNSTSCSFTVTVKTPQAVIQGLIDSVNSSSLNPTTKGGLTSKLNAARDAINSGQTNVACNKLDAFNSQVQNLVSHGDISAAQGQAWINSSNHVRNTIGCTNLGCS